MQVTVGFGMTTNFNGASEGAIELEDGATLADLKDVLAERAAGGRASLKAKAFLVNRAAATDETLLHDGDNVIVWQPHAHG